MTITEQTITLNGLRFYSYHGAEPQEAVVGAWYTVDLIMKVQVTKAIENDTLADTVNYALVTEIVKKEMAVRSKLLEHVAGRILSSLFENFGAIIRPFPPPAGKPASLSPPKNYNIRDGS